MMRRRTLALLIVGVALTVMIGGAIILESPKRSDGNTLSTHFELSEPSISETTAGYRFSFRLVVTGHPANVSVMHVRLLDAGCNELERVEFTGIQQEGLQGLRGGANVTEIPHFVMITGPDRFEREYPTPVVVHGLHRTGSTPTNGSYRWTEYRVDEPIEQSEWCPNVSE